MPTIRQRLHSLIYEHDTPAERAFDVVFIGAILLSVLVVMLDSIATLSARYGRLFQLAEWGFTALFTVEYVLRVWAAHGPGRYARSFFGVVDLLALLPTYLSVLFPAGRFLIAFRILRVLRVFRILKLATYVREASVLTSALRASRQKIIVFVSTVLTVVVVVGSTMFLIEGPESGFTSIPIGIYWAIVTLTTVGYGDVAPQTVLGRLVASALMVLGYGIIAVPTGIVTLELQRASREAGAAPSVGRRCTDCALDRHEEDAIHCRRCGALLPA
jgi:voltage-gated potassium channel